ncbi:MAG: type Z 30S ribosomal protein S14 [Ignavibacteria bacterium]|nr:type Z 30S ribosomal protein S14 [Ignavibacteria bacterium]
MARLAMVVKAKKTPKYAVRKHNRCGICGRPRAYLRKFGICRICFRKMTLEGKIPGVTKASW